MGEGEKGANWESSIETYILPYVKQTAIGSLLYGSGSSHLVLCDNLEEWELWRKSICLQCWRPAFNPWVGKIPWRRKWQPTPVFLPGESHGQRSLADYSPWGRKESDTTEQLYFRGVGRGGRWEGGPRGREHMYTYGWFMLTYGRKLQYCQVIILQLKIINKKENGEIGNCKRINCK